ncbi:hypothetical protein MRB53_042052 [Persea americana]|nr:hypothetical protein MRB53_042052 [Persea americana]
MMSNRSHLAGNWHRSLLRNHYVTILYKQHTLLLLRPLRRSLTHSFVKQASSQSVKMGVPENNGVPQQTTGTVEPSHAQQTAPTHDPVSPLANDNAITSTQPQAHSVAPPAYEKAPQSEQPGVPRNDDPARVEANRGPQQQQLAPPAIATPLQNLREDSAWIDCPFCHQRSVTDPRSTLSSAVSAVVVLAPSSLSSSNGVQIRITGARLATTVLLAFRMRVALVHRKSLVLKH